MMWTFLILSLGIVVWWGIGLAIGVRLGYKNGLERAEIDEPDEPQIFGSNNPVTRSDALSADEIDNVDEWDDP